MSSGKKSLDSVFAKRDSSQNHPCTGLTEEECAITEEVFDITLTLIENNCEDDEMAEVIDILKDLHTGAKNTATYKCRNGVKLLFEKTGDGINVEVIR